MGQLPAVDVVICAYTNDRRADLTRAIQSVRRQTIPTAQLILVVDHNPDLLGWAESQFSSDCRVLSNTERRGLSGARNTGWRAATGEVVAFLDDDAEADERWIERLAAAYDSVDVIAVGGHVEPSWDQTQPHWFPPEFYWVIGCSHQGLPNERAEVRNVIGANMSIRREVLQRVDGFESELGRVGQNPVGCEETELCIRASAHVDRARVVYEPAARVRHRVPAARGTWNYFRRRCYAEGLSKAHASRISSGAPLRTERSYVATVLPAGIRRGFASALNRRAVEPLLESLAIVSGLAITSVGYAVGSLNRSGPLASLPISPSNPLSKRTQS